MIFLKIINHGLPSKKMVAKFVFDENRFNGDSSKLEKHIEELGNSLMNIPCSIPKSELEKMVREIMHYLERLLNASLHAIDYGLLRIISDNLQSLRGIMKGTLPIMSFLDSLLKGVDELEFSCMVHDEENGLGHRTKDHKSLEPLKRVKSLTELLKMFLESSGVFRFS